MERKSRDNFVYKIQNMLIWMKF